MIRVLFLIWVFALSHTSFAESEEETLQELIDSH